MDIFLLIMTAILYVLSAVVLTGLIVLIIKMISTITKINHVAEEVQEKVKSFNGFFHIMDSMSDKLSLVGDKMVDGAANFIIGLFKKNKKNKESEEKENEEE